MDLANGERSSELLQAQAHVWNHIFNFINSMSLKCAIQLGIPDIIHNHCQPMTLHELVAKLPVRPNKTLCVHRLMRILVHSGFFTKQRVQESADEEGYINGTMGLCKCLVQNDDPTPFFTAHGRTLWDYGCHEPRFNNFFNEGMASDARLVTSVLVKECKGAFEGLNSFVDVGGGTEQWLRPLSRRSHTCTALCLISRTWLLTCEEAKT
ncbi:Trans-resveratrol di-O-methyltransferase [Vitis vinifera]|uniref:Trans-resveratrol di-O-methyltransferase n=1 Tax=Vitis vinifera TaxID=29760 RepID=A0A438EG70_VITVI|nr:Trans-resveratrol di-O-methyltransferase [Vitis vinifera]